MARPSSEVAAEVEPLVLFFGYVPAAITHFVPFEVGDLIDRLSGFGPIANFGHRTFVPMVWMEVVIYVTFEVLVAMKPRAGANEDTPSKPFRAVVAVRSTGVRRDVIVAVRADRGRPNADSDLSIHFRSRHG